MEAKSCSKFRWFHAVSTYFIGCFPTYLTRYLGGEAKRLDNHDQTCFKIPPNGHVFVFSPNDVFELWMRAEGPSHQHCFASEIHHICLHLHPSTARWRGLWQTHRQNTFAACNGRMEQVGRMLQYVAITSTIYAMLVVLLLCLLSGDHVDIFKRLQVHHPRRCKVGPALKTWNHI